MAMAFFVFIGIALVATAPLVKSTTITTLPVFQKGPYSTNNLTVDSDKFKGEKPPPRSLLIVFPTEGDMSYPVILFFHGFILHNTYYRNVFDHIASHGFIVVAPQMHLTDQVGLNQWPEIRCAGEVADWMHGNLELNLPHSVLPDLSLVAVAGHSRGGKTAFAVALGLSNTTQKLSAVIGMDPVAGDVFETPPQILDQSFNISIPIAVIGMGRKPHPCAPDGMNHDEFFTESKPTRAHFVAKDYSHMDVLDDDLPLGIAISVLCGSRLWVDNGPLRRSVGGIMVAFLNASFNCQTEDLQAIVGNRSVAPVTLDPVLYDPAAGTAAVQYLPA